MSPQKKSKLKSIFILIGTYPNKGVFLNFNVTQLQVWWGLHMAFCSKPFLKNLGLCKKVCCFIFVKNSVRFIDFLTWMTSHGFWMISSACQLFVRLPSSGSLKAIKVFPEKSVSSSGKNKCFANYGLNFKKRKKVLSSSPVRGELALPCGESSGLYGYLAHFPASALEIFP